MQTTPLLNQQMRLVLSSQGRVLLRTVDADEMDPWPQVVIDKIQTFFTGDDHIGLLRLGLTQFDQPLPPDVLFWRQFSQLFIATICQHKVVDQVIAKWIQSLPLPKEEVESWRLAAPFMRGMEHLTLEIANSLWQGLKTALIAELKAFNGDLSTYLTTYHSSWNSVGRVCFHLAENKSHPDRPFAFLATYTTRLSSTAQAQHVPLGRALEEYASAGQQPLLLALLLPVQRAVEKSTFLRNLLDSREIFQPLAWQPAQAYQFLKDIPLFEAAGVMVRVPNWWNPKKPPRPTIQVSVGEQKGELLSLDAMLDFSLQVALPSGEILTDKELQQLMSDQTSLVVIKGQWVHIDAEQLQQALSHWKQVERQVKKRGLSFTEGMRLLAGIASTPMEDTQNTAVADWSVVGEGKSLRATLDRLRDSGAANHKSTLAAILQQHLPATLRPYQQRGVEWLWWLYQLQLGGCLADDMGLGKTMQVLSLFLVVQQQSSTARTTHLLIVPASLLGNWQAEMQRFTPGLRLMVLHRSILPKENKQDRLPNLTGVDVVMTTYATFTRLPGLQERNWDIVILDEAQAIKNPATQQARLVKQLKSRIRLALTGTPIENRLLDLWSLFDFIAPGLLGSSRAFADYGKKKSSPANAGEVQQKHFYAAIRRLISPYILRRLKTDKTIISDLPDKTEMQTYCTLTKAQAGLYQQAVDELSQQLKQVETESLKRRGLVLAYLLRLKQICNHPDQWLGHGDYASDTSGKFIRLKELCATIAEKQEKVLVFTQFREIIPALQRFLAELFSHEGTFLHGQTPIMERSKRVAAFQQESGPPFFILSLKAGGSGLNLTAASHVIHFDRWWNPAVENQATDRAFRIGQKKNVLVHKLICRGTIEEKIDQLILSKKSLSAEIMESGGETLLTELSNEELIKIVSLDIHRALGD